MSRRHARIVVAAVSLLSLLPVRPASAVERIRFDEPAYQQHLLDALARATALRPMRPDDGDEIRAWFSDPMSGNTHGYIVTRYGARTCRLKFDNHDDSLFVHRGNCGAMRRYPSRIERLMTMLADAPELAPRAMSWANECTVWDGWEAEVEGIVGGRRFHFTVSNTNGCLEFEDARRFDDLLDAVRAAYDPRSR